MPDPIDNGTELAKRYVVVGAVSGEPSLTERWQAQRLDTDDRLLLTRLSLGSGEPITDLDRTSERLRKLVHPNIRRHIDLIEDDQGRFLVDDLTTTERLTPFDGCPSDEQLSVILSTLDYAERLGFTQNTFDSSWLSSDDLGTLKIAYTGWPESLLTGQQETADISPQRKFTHWLLQQVSDEPYVSSAALALVPKLTPAAQRVIQVGMTQTHITFGDLLQSMTDISLQAEAANSQLTAASFTKPSEKSAVLESEPVDQRTEDQPRSLQQPIIAAVLVLIGGFVFFVLPDLATQSPIDPAKTSEAPATPIGTPTQINAGPAPVAAARNKIAGEQATELAETFLRKLIHLEDLGISLWAPETLTQLNDQAIEADEAFRANDNLAALTQYQTLLEAVIAVEAELPSRKADYRERASLALDQGETDATMTLWEIVARLHPEDTAIQSTWSEVQNIPGILALMAEASLAQDAGELSSAKDKLIEAKALYPTWKPLLARLNALDQTMTQRAYQKAMSAGFANLKDSNFTAAIKAFNQALNLRPSDAAATDGLAQVMQAQSQNAWQAQLQVARTAAADGQWQTAKTAFETLLSQAPGLTGLQNDIQQMAQRLTLSSELAQFFENPAKLQTDAALQAAKALALDISQLSAPTGDLQKQLPKLTRLIRNARRPLPLTITSDGQTQVTVLRIGAAGDLGQITTQQLTLIPGRYILVGSRPGYRDVRQELTLSVDEPNPSIAVICQDRI